MNPDENHHSNDARGWRLGGGTLLQHSNQPSLWRRTLVRGGLDRRRRRGMGLPLLLGRGMQAECNRRQSGLLQSKSLVCADDIWAQEALKTARAAELDCHGSLG